MAEDASGLLLIPVLRLLHAFAAKIIASEIFFFHLVIDRRNRLLDDVAVHSLRLQVVDDAHAAEFLVVAAIGRKCRRVLGVVQIALVLQANDNQFHQRLANFRIGFYAVAKQALQVRDRTHAARQRAYGVVVKLRFGEEFSGTAKRHFYTIDRDEGSEKHTLHLGEAFILAACSEMPAGAQSV